MKFKNIDNIPHKGEFKAGEDPVEVYKKCFDTNSKTTLEYYFPTYIDCEYYFLDINEKRRNFYYRCCQ